MFAWVSVDLRHATETALMLWPELQENKMSALKCSDALWELVQWQSQGHLWHMDKCLLSGSTRKASDPHCMESCHGNATASICRIFMLIIVSVPGLLMSREHWRQIIQLMFRFCLSVCLCVRVRERVCVCTHNTTHFQNWHFVKVSNYWLTLVSRRDNVLFSISRLAWIQHCARF